MATLFHYTTRPLVDDIIEEREIPTTSVDGDERVVRLSSNPEWDVRANRRIKTTRTSIELNEMGTQRMFGRYQVEAKCENANRVSGQLYESTTSVPIVAGSAKRWNGNRWEPYRKSRRLPEFTHWEFLNPDTQSDVVASMQYFSESPITQVPFSSVLPGLKNSDLIFCQVEVADETLLLFGLSTIANVANGATRKAKTAIVIQIPRRRIYLSRLLKMVDDTKEFREFDDSIPVD